MPFTPVVAYADAPPELRASIAEFFPQDKWEEAANVAYLESGWSPFAVANTVDTDHPCGTIIAIRHGVPISAERSVGYFQINVCSFPTWDWTRLYNAEQNVGTAHMLWDAAGQSWTPWRFSMNTLGLS